MVDCLHTDAPVLPRSLESPPEDQLKDDRMDEQGSHVQYFHVSLVSGFWK